MVRQEERMEEKDVQEEHGKAEELELKEKKRGSGLRREEDKEKRGGSEGCWHSDQSD